MKKIQLHKSASQNFIDVQEENLLNSFHFRDEVVVQQNVMVEENLLNSFHFHYEMSHFSSGQYLRLK